MCQINNIIVYRILYSKYNIVSLYIMISVEHICTGYGIWYEYGIKRIQTKFSVMLNSVKSILFGF